MKKIIFVLALFISLASLGQSIDILEEKNGYKIFKINTSKDVYANSIKLVESKNGFSKYIYLEGDKDLFNLFGFKVNSILLTFDDSNNTLKKISLDLNESLSMNHLGILGFRLKKLYQNFANLIGPTTAYNKPTSDCERFSNQSCLYFEDRIFDGEILWESKSVVLRINHKTETEISSNGQVNLLVSRVISFVEKSYNLIEKKSSF